MPPTAPVCPDAYLQFMLWAEHPCPQNSCAESHPQGDGVRRWGPREAIRSRVELPQWEQGACEDPPEPPRPFCHVGPQGEEAGNQGVCPQETANAPLPCPWPPASSLRTGEWVSCLSLCVLSGNPGWLRLSVASVTLGNLPSPLSCGAFKRAVPSAWSPSRPSMKVGTSGKSAPATRPAPRDSLVAPVHFLHGGRPQWQEGVRHRSTGPSPAAHAQRPELAGVSEDAGGGGGGAGQFRLCWA